MPARMSDFFEKRDEEAEALQDDLDFWRKKLMQDRAEISYYQAMADSHMDRINEVKRKAHTKGIELS